MDRQASIGELNERSLHRALKARYAVSGSVTEKAVDGFVADVVIGNRIVEVHTGSFSPLKKKLPRLLERHAVTLVYPIARDRYIVKVATDPEVPAKRRKSPKHGTVFQVFSALSSIPSLLSHPNLTLEIVMTVEEELRLISADGRRRRRGWVSLDRRLMEVVATHTIASMADLFAILDPGLPEHFTSNDVAKVMNSSRRLAGQAAFCFREGGVSEICGKRGNAFVYRRVGRPRVTRGSIASRPETAP